MPPTDTVQPPPSPPRRPRREVRCPRCERFCSTLVVNGSVEVGVKCPKCKHFFTVTITGAKDGLPG